MTRCRGHLGIASKVWGPAGDGLEGAVNVVLVGVLVRSGEALVVLRGFKASSCGHGIVQAAS